MPRYVGGQSYRRRMTLGKQRKPESKHVWFRFSLRTLLLLVTLVAITLAIYEPLTLHFKAVHFFSIENTLRATRAHPEELLYNIEGRDKAVVCHVGKVRIVLLGRTHSGTAGGFIPIAGDQPRRGSNTSVTGEVYFSYLYANGKAACEVHGFPFLCKAGTVEIKEQSLNSNSPAVVLVDADDQILKTYSQ